MEGRGKLGKAHTLKLTEEGVLRIAPGGPQLDADEGRRADDVDGDDQHRLLHRVDLGARDERVGALGGLLLRARVREAVAAHGLRLLVRREPGGKTGRPRC